MYNAFNSKNIETLDNILSSRFYSHPLKSGVDGVKKAWAKMQQANPDIQVKVEDMIIDQDKVASRTTVHGISSSVNEEPPMILEIIRIENGKIAEIWGLTNIKR